MKYDPAVVAAMRVMDFASRGDGGRVSEEADASALRYRYDGWLFPRAGLVFAWTLANEGSIATPRTAAAASHPEAPKRSVPTARANPVRKGDVHPASKIKRDARHRQAA